MKVLVAGSEGSLMQWVIPHLIKAGHEVTGVDNCSRYGLIKLVDEDIDQNRSYRFIRGDLTNMKTVDAVCKDIDVIVQAAAQVYGVKGFHKFPASILSRDIHLHQNLLWAAVRHNMSRMVYLSSSMVYERAEQVPVAEEDIDRMRVPFTDYGLSKFVCERLCKAFKKQFDLDYTIWRPFNMITPFERGEKEAGMSHVFADFIRKLLVEMQNPLEIFGDGEQVRCFTWIDDVAKTIAEYSFKEVTVCEEFNLGNPENVTMKELAQMIFDKLRQRGLVKGKLGFRQVPIYHDDVRIRIPSVEKAQKLLNWQVSVSLDEALDRCIDEALKHV